MSIRRTGELQHKLHFFMLVRLLICEFTGCYVFEMIHDKYIIEYNTRYLFMLQTTSDAVCLCPLLMLFLPSAYSVDSLVFVFYIDRPGTLVWDIPGALPGFRRGGARIIFLRFGNLPCALLRGSGACSSDNFLLNGAIWCSLTCILIRFCLEKFPKLTYLYIKNNYYSHTFVMMLHVVIAPG